MINVNISISLLPVQDQIKFVVSCGMSEKNGIMSVGILGIQSENLAILSTDSHDTKDNILFHTNHRCWLSQIKF